MTPIEWDNLLARNWRDCYPQVFEEAKRQLGTYNKDVELTTTELVEAMYPEQFARGNMIARRQKIFKALKAAQGHGGLRGYWHLGTERRYMGRPFRPPVWHRYLEEHDQGDPHEVECPVCGHKFNPTTGLTGDGHAR